MANLSIYKLFYNNLCNTVGNLHYVFVYCPMNQPEVIENDMQLNGWAFLNFEKQINSREIIKVYNYFFILMVVFQQMKRFPRETFQILQVPIK